MLQDPLHLWKQAWTKIFGFCVRHFEIQMHSSCVGSGEWLSIYCSSENRNRTFDPGREAVVATIQSIYNCILKSRTQTRYSERRGREFLDKMFGYDFMPKSASSYLSIPHEPCGRDHLSRSASLLFSEGSSGASYG